MPPRAPLFGSHLSIAGSMAQAVRDARALKLEALQVFTKNQQQWKVSALKQEVIDEWQSELAASAWNPRERVVSHASYLINLASPDDALWKKSIDLMTVEVTRCEELGIGFLVHHPGASTTSTPDEGMRRIAAAYDELFARTRGRKVILCLENTVGSGSNLGGPFDQLALLRSMIVDATGEAGAVGFCIDTCHAHAAGNDMSTEKAAGATLDALDATCGLQHVRVLHLNDSKGGLGSHLDRHEHIGKGHVGQAKGGGGFAAVVNRAELAGRPMILETPKGENDAGTAHDTLNLRRLRKLVRTSG
jgi:deoxyribonuclease-4